MLAGQRFGIPVKGTHAHSWVMAFEDEETAFAAYAKAFPDDSVFLVDTYDTLEGVRQAIKVAREMALLPYTSRVTTQRSQRGER